MNLYKASNQWATRPADERFWTLEEMRAATKAYADASRSATIQYGNVEVLSNGTELFLKGQTGTQARLTHYAMGQLCSRASAPASYLRTLPANLAAQNLNVSLAKREPTDKAKLLVHVNGDIVLRCMTGEGYERVWNHEVISRLIDVAAKGWKVPPARPSGKPGEQTRVATEADCLSRKLPGLSINPGDLIAPAGLYASDRDMFAFLVDDDHTVENPADKGTPLARGFFVWNSEVGDASFGFSTFLYDAVCGNHIVWGAQEVKEVRIRHVGTARERAFRGLHVSLREYANASAQDDTRRIAKAQSYILGATKQEAIDAAFSFISRKRISVLNQGMVENAYAIAAETPRYGNPNTPWAIAQGLTQLSQASEYADRRVQIDTAAGKLLEMAF